MLVIKLDGQMFTCGTSHYLKHQFGVGYNLTIVKQENANASLIEAYVKSHVTLTLSFDT